MFYNSICIIVIFIILYNGRDVLIFLRNYFVILGVYMYVLSFGDF